MKKSVICLLSACLILLIGACSQAKKSSEEIYMVKTIKPQLVDQMQSGDYVGTVEALVSVPLSFPLNGIIKSIKVQDGDYVQKGQLIAELDDRTERDALAISTAKEKQAQDAYNRLEKVYKNGSLPDVKWVEIETNLEQAKAMNNISKKNLEDCKLYAPASGFMASKKMDPGMAVLPDQPVISLVQIDQVNITISVPENEIARIKKGQMGKISVSALGNKTFTGKVTEIGVVADMISHTYPVKLSLNNSSHELKPGMAANVRLSFSGGIQCGVVPLQAVMTDAENNKYLYVIQGQTAEKKYVKTGNMLPEGIVITAGIDSLDMVIVEGQNKIINGSVVKTVSH